MRVSLEISTAFSGMFFGSTMLMVTIALVMAVITTNIYNKKDSLYRCPHWVVMLAAKFYPAHLQPPDRYHDSFSKHSCNGRSGRGAAHGDVMTISTDGGAAEIDSLTCGCCCHCRKDSVSGIQGMYLHPAHQPHAGFDYERAEAEWKMVARFADRVFFWVFFALSSAVQTILFTQMVPDSRLDGD